MERISIFNYEAYLLDLIEGTISDTDKTLLLDFLKVHPELDVDWDDLPSLSTEALILDDSFKQGLKITDTELDAVSIENIDTFLIAQTEGLLTEAKEKEVNTFIAFHPEVKEDQRKYQKAHLIADKNVVFTDKDSLKQRSSVVLWPYWAAAAAVILAVLFFINSNRVDSSPQMAKDQSVKIKTINSPNHTEEELVHVQLPDETIEMAEKQIEGTESVLPQKNKLGPQVKPKEVILHEALPQLAINRMNSVESVSGSNLEKEDFKEVPPVYTQPIDDVAVVEFSDMNNPIKPLTKRLSNVTNTDMDLRMAKANDTQTGGFYFKLGKVEVSRRTYR